ncbi:MAG: hypothetical protein BMS9Abin12_2193 [Acidimicrobiia bacterium]|nr:MAG: hypothetical protein BMS9Abin12_2193 [Acidimicrobiia bacterium]
MEVSVTLEVKRRPEIDRLVTFAIQGAFVKPGGGSCNFGLQHHPQFPKRGAVNWNGYDAKGDPLDSTAPTLPSSTDDVATRDYAWEQGVPYQFTVARGNEGSDGDFPWTGSITNQRTGEREMVRELVSKSPHMRAPVMYIESFSPCDGPGFEARWSNAIAVSLDGGVRAVQSMRVDYQPHAAGGCTNTNASVEGSAFVQRVGQMRTTKPGTTIRLD